METFAGGSELSMILRYRDRLEDPALTSKNRQSVMQALDKVALGDADAFWALFDPEVVFYEAGCLPYGGAHQGIEATKAAFAKLSDTFSENHVVFEEVLGAEELVIAYQTISFRVKANGATGSIPVAELFRFRNGKVIEWRALYFDSDLVARAIKAGQSR